MVTQTSHSYDGAKPEYGEVEGFAYVKFWVGNAKQAAEWAVARLGFTPYAYQGLETGSRDIVTHVVRQGAIVFAYASQLKPGPCIDGGDDIGAHVIAHGDGVKDVAFAVSNCKAIFASAVARGATPVAEPKELSDADGTVIIATVRTYGDTLHSFVQRGAYRGAFLPGYRAVTRIDPLERITPPIGLDFIDHVVGNMPDKGMLPQVEWYERVLQFHRFWSVDDSQITTEFSSLRSIVMASHNEIVKMPINEPALGKRKSQIQVRQWRFSGLVREYVWRMSAIILSALNRRNSSSTTGEPVCNTLRSTLETLSQPSQICGPEASSSSQFLTYTTSS